MPDTLYVLRSPTPVTVRLIAFRFLDLLCTHPVHQRALGNSQDVRYFLGLHVRFTARLHWIGIFLMLSVQDLHCQQQSDESNETMRRGLFWLGLNRLQGLGKQVRNCRQ